MAESSEPVTEQVWGTLRSGERARRLVHASGAGLPALYLLELITWPQVRLAYLLGSVLVALLETARLSVGFDWAIYEHLTREYETDNVAGYALYMFSSAAVAVLFEPQVAIPAILMLALGDPLSGMIASGELRTVKRPKALAAMFCICAVIALPFLFETPLAVVFGAVGGMVADGVKPTVRGYIVDDNLTIPPVAAAAIWVGIEVTARL